METINNLVDYFGGVSALCRELGINRSAFYQWKGKVPKSRCYEIEEMTFGKFSKCELRPDLFGKTKRKQRAKHEITKRN